MYIKEITYEDYNGDKVTEKFYFNFTKAELATMNLQQEGGLRNYIERITNTRNTPELIKLFQDLILKAYGEKSDDGKHFVKVRDGHKLAEDFAQTDAYSEYFMLLVQNDKEAEKFVNGVIPKELLAEVQRNQKNGITGSNSSVTAINEDA